MRSGRMEMKSMHWPALNGSHLGGLLLALGDPVRRAEAEDAARSKKRHSSCWVQL